MGKKSMSGRKLTFLLITIPIVALFFCFNTLPLIKGVIYSFTNFKGYGSYDWVGLRNYKDLFTDSRVGGSYLFTFKHGHRGNHCNKCTQPDLGTWTEQQDPIQECTAWSLFYSECTWCTGRRIYFQLFLYIYPACIRKDDRK